MTIPQWSTKHAALCALTEAHSTFMHNIEKEQHGMNHPAHAGRQHATGDHIEHDFVYKGEWKQ